MLAEGNPLGHSEPITWTGPVNGLKFPTLGTRRLCEQQRNTNLNNGEFNHRIVRGHFRDEERWTWVNRWIFPLHRHQRRPLNPSAPPHQFPMDKDNRGVTQSSIFARHTRQEEEWGPLALCELPTAERHYEQECFLLPRRADNFTH